MKWRVILEPDRETKEWAIWCPELPGCVSSGITEIEALLDNELNFYEQTVFLYATGYFEFKRHSDSGIEKMKQAIQVLDILGEDKLKLHYTSHFDELVNKE